MASNIATSPLPEPLLLLHLSTYIRVNQTFLVTAPGIWSDRHTRGSWCRRGGGALLIAQVVIVLIGFLPALCCLPPHRCVCASLEPPTDNCSAPRTQSDCSTPVIQINPTPSTPSATNHLTEQKAKHHR